jgi:hypothetical protein
MPFNTLLTRCLMPKNSFTENKVRVSVKSGQDERVLFFRTDEGPESPFRRDMGHDGKLCDLVVFFARGSRNVLCLVELKRGDLGDAIEQILTTRDVFVERFKSDPYKRAIQNDLHYKCYIRCHGSSPQEKSKKVKLDRIFGKGKWMVSEKDDMGEFLRGE